MFLCFVFKQKTAYELLISDWSSDVCFSDLMFPQKLIESTEINGCVNDPKNRLAKKLDGEDAKTILNKANPTRFVNANTSSNNASKAVVVFLVGPLKPAEPAEIGRASCRERVCQYV